MDIRLATTDAEIEACHGVMRHLRPHVAREEFVARVRRQQAGGFHLAALWEHGRPVAVAGFRLGDNLAWGRFLYVDDLVTDPALRSRGHGRALLAWLADHARERGCAELHLDSGVQRIDAHRFYEREGMQRTSYHFRSRIAQDGGTGHALAARERSPDGR